MFASAEAILASGYCLAEPTRPSVCNGGLAGELGKLRRQLSAKLHETRLIRDEMKVAAKGPRCQRHRNFRVMSPHALRSRTEPEYQVLARKTRKDELAIEIGGG